MIFGSQNNCPELTKPERDVAALFSLNKLQRSIMSTNWSSEEIAESESVCNDFLRCWAGNSEILTDKTSLKQTNEEKNNPKVNITILRGIWTEYWITFPYSCFWWRKGRKNSFTLFTPLDKVYAVYWSTSFYIYPVLLVIQAYVKFVRMYVASKWTCDKSVIKLICPSFLTSVRLTIFEIFWLKLVDWRILSQMRTLLKMVSIGHHYSKWRIVQLCRIFNEGQLLTFFTDFCIFT